MVSLSLTTNGECLTNTILFLVFLCLSRFQRPRGLKAWVYGRSPAHIAGSNPAGSMDVSLLCVLCVVSSFAGIAGSNPALSMVVCLLRVLSICLLVLRVRIPL